MMASSAATIFDSKLKELFGVINAHCSSPENVDVLGDLPAYLEELVAQHPPPVPPIFERKLQKLLGVIRDHCTSDSNVDVLADIPDYLERLVLEHPPSVSERCVGRQPKPPVTLNIPAYPHILHLIISHADRPTLATLARVSPLAKAMAIRKLYSWKIVDPVKSAPSVPGLSILPLLTPERTFAKLRSFLTSPYLSRVRHIEITNPWLWADHLQLLQALRGSVERGPATILTVHMAIPGVGRSVQWDWHGNVIVKEAQKRKKGKKKKQGAAPAGAAEGDVAEGEMASYTVAEGDGHDEMLRWPLISHITRLATLIPANHLVISVPESAGVDLNHILTMVTLIYVPPPSMRNLSLLWRSGNIFGMRGPTPREGNRWDSIDMVLVPSSSGNWSYSQPSFITGQVETDRDVLRDGLITTLALPSFPMRPSAAFTVVGIEGLPEARIDMAEYRREVQLKGQQHFYFMSPYRGAESHVQIQFSSWRKWRKLMISDGVLD